MTAPRRQDRVVSEAELLRAYGSPITGNPLDVHEEVQNLARSVDVIAREVLVIRQLLELLVAEAELDPPDMATAIRRNYAERNPDG